MIVNFPDTVIATEFAKINKKIHTSFLFCGGGSLSSLQFSSALGWHTPNPSAPMCLRSYDLHVFRSEGSDGLGSHTKKQLQGGSAFCSRSPSGRLQGGRRLLPAAPRFIGRPAVQMRYKNPPCVCGGAKESPDVSQCGFVFGLIFYL